LLENACQNLRQLELLIQASQGASSNKWGIKNASFFVLYNTLKKWKVLYNLSSLPFLRFFYTFLTLFGINWNHKRLKKGVQDILSSKKYQNDHKTNTRKHPEGAKAIKRNLESAKKKNQPKKNWFLLKVLQKENQVPHEENHAKIVQEIKLNIQSKNHI
jgi:hypothetical protein